MAEPFPASVAFRVDGIPVPQGSTKSFAVKTKSGKYRAVTTSDNPKTKPWRADIIAVAKDFGPFTGPIEVGVKFYLPRPQGHYGVKGNILPSAPLYHLVKPDLDKLLRALGDALKSAGVYKDDSHVVAFLFPQKLYCDMPGSEDSPARPGAEIIIRYRDNP